VPPPVDGFVIDAERTPSVRYTCGYCTWRGYRLTDTLVPFKETQLEIQGPEAMRRCALRTLGNASAGLQPHAPRLNRSDFLFQEVEVVDHAAFHYIVLRKNRDDDFGFRVR
jgi:hypothetical protein